MDYLRELIYFGRLNSACFAECRSHLETPQERYNKATTAEKCQNKQKIYTFTCSTLLFIPPSCISLENTIGVVMPNSHSRQVTTVTVIFRFHHSNLSREM